MPEEKLKTYTLKEIAEHSNSDSPWIIIDNGVYDVTKFLNEHPGGEETLLDWAGKEATDAFEDVGHSSDARALMKEYKIGELCEDDQKSKAKMNGSSSCICMRILIPLGVVLSAVLLYQVYSHLKK